MPPSGLRREPRQRRSRERVERILTAAAELLVHGGPDALRPTHVAERAKVPVGSVYMYFDDRDGLLAVLVERYYARVQELLRTELQEADDVEGLLAGIERATWSWYRLHGEEPSFTPLMMAILGNPVLQRRNLDDSLQSAELVLDKVRELGLAVDETEMRRGVLLLLHLFAGALQVVHLADDPAECDATFATWADIVLAQARRWIGRER